MPTITPDEFKKFIKQFLGSIEKDPHAVKNLLAEAGKIEKNAISIEDYDHRAAGIMLGIVANYRAAAGGLQNLRDHYSNMNRN